MQKGAEVMHRFDYSFLDNGMLPAGLLNITADIYSPGFVHEKKLFLSLSLPFIGPPFH